MKLEKLAQNEAVKEFSRLILIAVIPALLDSLQLGEINFRSLLLVAIIAGLKAVDKYLHKKDSDNAVTNFLRFE
jgi:hypothetical protein